MQYAGRYFRFWSAILTAIILATSFDIAPLISQAHAASTYDFIVSDADMLDVSSMTQETLRKFLLERGTLGKARFMDRDGIERPAYEILYRVAQKHGINPKFLLVLLQREQSLVEDSTPTQDQYDWAMGYGVCDSCAKNDPLVQPFRGFANQLEEAAERLQEYLTFGIGVQPGTEVLINGELVTPLNKATAALYTYTPHLHGNMNFKNIWKRYFTMKYPDGTLLKAKGQPAVYLIHYGRKRAFANYASLTSRFDPRNIVTVAASDLEPYENGPVIHFPNYSLLQTPDEQRYLLVDEVLRPIDAESFRAIGFNPDELIPAQPEDISEYELGTALTAESAQIQDELVQASNGAVFAVRDGIRHPIVSPEILRDRYPNQRARKALRTPSGETELDALPMGDPIGFRNGTLVKAKNVSSVYLISNGVRRPILSAASFTHYGFEYKDIITTSASALEVHPLGNPI